MTDSSPDRTRDEFWEIVSHELTTADTDSPCVSPAMGSTESNPDRRGPIRFQFGLRTLLGGITLLSILLAWGFRTKYHYDVRWKISVVVRNANGDLIAVNPILHIKGSSAHAVVHVPAAKRGDKTYMVIHAHESYVDARNWSGIAIVGSSSLFGGADIMCDGERIDQISKWNGAYASTKIDETTCRFVADVERLCFPKSRPNWSGSTKAVLTVKVIFDQATPADGNRYGADPSP